MDERIMLIGETVNPNVPGPPLEGIVGARLADYAGLTADEYLARTERHNLLDVEWTNAEARFAAEAVWPSLVGRRTILLGQRVGAAFGFTSWPILTWAAIDKRGTMIAIVPHPSGLNRWWNEAPNRAAARRFLRATFGTETDDG